MNSPFEPNQRVQINITSDLQVQGNVVGVHDVAYNPEKKPLMHMVMLDESSMKELNTEWPCILVHTPMIKPVQTNKGETP